MSNPEISKPDDLIVMDTEPWKWQARVLPFGIGRKLFPRKYIAILKSYNESLDRVIESTWTVRAPSNKAASAKVWGIIEKTRDKRGSNNNPDHNNSSSGQPELPNSDTKSSSVARFALIAGSLALSAYYFIDRQPEQATYLAFIGLTAISLLRGRERFSHYGS